jgi:hypothetical protein
VTEISFVCKEWYSFVWNSPSLWHTLKLNFDSKNDIMNLESYESFKKFCKQHTKLLSSVKKLVFINTKIKRYKSWEDKNMEILSNFINLTELNLQKCYYLNTIDVASNLTNLT